MSEELKKGNQIFKLQDAENFVPVVKYEGDKVVTFYGGDQAWFKTRVGRYSGCGSVAAADMFAYIARRDPRYRSLFAHDSAEITVETFLKHMEDSIRYVAPLNIQKLDIPYGGLTSLPRFARNCEDFAASRGIKLKAQCVRADKVSLEQAAAIIAEQLSKDNPLALLMMQNRKVKAVAYADAYGKPTVSDMRFHWVAVTAMAVTPEKTVIEVSSEGGHATLDLRDVWCGGEPFFGMHGLVYLEAIEAR